MQTTHSSLQGIQFLRAVAAILVVCEHAAKMMAFPEHFGASPSEVFHHGNVGVLIFFVISGFIIFIVTFSADLSTKVGLGEFAIKRFLRIIPFLWFCVLAYAAIRFAGTGQWDPLPTARALFIWPVGELRPNVVWSLRHEIIFYLVYGLTLLAFRRVPSLLVAWMIAPVVIFFIPESPFTASPWTQVFFNPVNLYFAAGCLLGLLYIRKNIVLCLNLPGGLLTAVLGSIGMMIFASLYTGESRSLAFVYLPIAACIVWLSINSRTSQSLLARLGHFLGDASYSIYLVHNIFLLVLLKAASGLHIQYNLFALHLLFVFLATTGGALIHILVERPLVRWTSGLVHSPKVV